MYVYAFLVGGQTIETKNEIHSQMFIYLLEEELYPLLGEASCIRAVADVSSQGLPFKVKVRLGLGFTFIEAQETIKGSFKEAWYWLIEPWLFSLHAPFLTVI